MWTNPWTFKKAKNGSDTKSELRIVEIEFLEKQTTD